MGEQLSHDEIACKGCLRKPSPRCACCGKRAILAVSAGICSISYCGRCYDLVLRCRADAAHAKQPPAEATTRCASCHFLGGQRRRGDTTPRVRLAVYTLREVHYDRQTAVPTTTEREALLCSACWLKWRQEHGHQLTTRERRRLGLALGRRARRTHQHLQKAG